MNTLTRRIGRRGQGMTEYIILVGLLCILLIGGVTTFKESVREAIEGTDGNGGMTGGVNSVGANMTGGGGAGALGNSIGTTGPGGTGDPVYNNGSGPMLANGTPATVDPN